MFSLSISSSVTYSSTFFNHIYFSIDIISAYLIFAMHQDSVLSTLLFVVVMDVVPWDLTWRIECRHFPKSVKCVRYLKGVLLQELHAHLQQQNVCSVTKMYVYCFLNILIYSLKISSLQYQNAFYAPELE